MKRITSIVSVALLTGLIVGTWLLVRQASLYEASDPAWDRMKPHLDQADREANKAIAEHLKSIDAFFAEAKKGTPQFAAKALGWGSKWRFVVDKLPFTRGDRNRKYLEQVFRECLFSPEQLDQAIHQAVQGVLDSTDLIENAMVVRIREDLADFPAENLGNSQDQKAFRKAYAQAISRVRARLGNDVRADVGREVVSIVAADMLGKLVVRRGVSAGILGAGLGGSWATFGVSLAVGVAVDGLISFVWNRLADPQGKLVRDVNAKIDDIHRLVIEGTPSEHGLRQRLMRFAKDRARIRREAIRELLHSKGGGR